MRAAAGLELVVEVVAEDLDVVIVVVPVCPGIRPTAPATPGRCCRSSTARHRATLLKGVDRGIAVGVAEDLAVIVVDLAPVIVAEVLSLADVAGEPAVVVAAEGLAVAVAAEVHAGIVGELVVVVIGEDLAVVVVALWL